MERKDISQLESGPVGGRNANTDQDVGADATLYRIAYLVSHPIQYQAPLLRLVAAQPDMDLTVFFQSDISVREFVDKGFGLAIKWDVPLLGGYRHEFLPSIGRRDVVSAQRPLSFGLARRLRRDHFDALWIHGYARGVNLLAIFFAKLAGLKIFVRDEATFHSAPRSILRRLAKRIFFSFLDRFVDGFLAIGTSNRNYYLSNGIKKDKIFLVPYAVDNEFFEKSTAESSERREEFRTQLALEPGRSIILFASKFQPRKRPDDLLHAYEKLIKGMPARHHPYLLFAGDGEIRTKVEADAKMKNLDKVHFLGFRNQSELPALFDLCDVFVLPSIHEPWGLIVNEAMAAGRPVIVADQVGCAADLVKPGVNGYRFPVGDINALSESLRAIVTSTDRGRAMGAAGREIIARWSFREDLEGLRSALRYSLRRRAS